MEEKIQLLHPDGKNMPRMDTDKYEQMKSAIIEVLYEKQITLKELHEELHKKLDDTFDGKVGWHAEAVKLDLIARSLIVRTNDKPQQYHLPN